jgi:hypothetical protein
MMGSRPLPSSALASPRIPGASGGGAGGPHGGGPPNQVVESATTGGRPSQAGAAWGSADKPGPERSFHLLSSDAQLARLSGCAPVPVSSGRTDRHRLALGADAGCVVTTARPASFRLV